MGLNLKQFDGSTVTPTDDAIMYDQMSSDYGIIDGCELTLLSTNIVSLSKGYALIKGRLIEVTDDTINCQLPSVDGVGRIYIQVDLTNTLSPAQLLTYAGTSLPELRQDERFNFTEGVFEMELAQYTATPTAIQTITPTAPTVKGGAAADAVTYDNSLSLLSATDVQGAIDEMAETLNNNLASQINEMYTRMFLNGFQNIGVRNVDFSTQAVASMNAIPINGGKKTATFTLPVNNANVMVFGFIFGDNGPNVKLDSIKVEGADYTISDFWSYHSSGWYVIVFSNITAKEIKMEITARNNHTSQPRDCDYFAGIVMDCLTL